MRKFVAKIQEIELHSRGIDFRTGEPYPVEPVEILVPPPTIKELVELMNNGQPINSVDFRVNETWDDEDGVNEDDEAKEYAMLEKCANETRFSERDPLFALQYVKMRLTDKEYDEYVRNMNTPPAPEPSPEPSPTDPEPAPEPASEPASTD